MRNAPQVIRKTMFLSKSYPSIALLWSKIYYHAPSAQASSSHHKMKSKRMQRLNSWQCQRIGPTQSISIVFTRPLTMWRRRRSMTVIQKSKLLEVEPNSVSHPLRWHTNCRQRCMPPSTLASHLSSTFSRMSNSPRQSARADPILISTGFNTLLQWQLLILQSNNSSRRPR